MGRILAIGSHPDDIELHCGGYLLKKKSEGCDIYYYVLSGDKKRIDEVLGTTGIIGQDIIEIDTFKDGDIEECPRMIDTIRELIENNHIDQVLTHWIGDYHQDHRAVAYATQAACRGKKIWLWQYPDNSFMFLNDSFNVTVDIEDVIEEKRELLDCFRSQKDKFYIKEAKKLTKEFFKVSANL